MSNVNELTSIWSEVLEGRHEPFELIVGKYQSAVSAVAYSMTGDLGLSQDIAQETFLIAWSSRQQLQQPERLGAWLCGIARNLSKQQLKRSRRTHAFSEGIGQVEDEHSGPEIRSITEEEQRLVQQALDAMPESYREAMILYYRQEESIAEVADCLGLTPEAVRQRLSRGRAVLRERLLYLVKETLVQTRPTRAFTRSVMAAIGGMSLAGQVAQAAVPASLTGAGLAAKTAVGGGVATGVGAVGGMLGLIGAWVGQWFHVRLVAREGERSLAQAYGRRALFLVAMLLVSTFGLSFLWRLPAPYGWIGYLVGLGVTLGLYQWQLIKAFRWKEREVARLRELGELGEENSTWLRRFMQMDSRSRYRWRGRVYRSRWKWGGLPLLDIQIADPGMRADRPRRTAVGWIAIGDYAEGRLLAMGERAYGLMAIGGIAKGLIAFGGIAIGGVAIGGIAIGGLCMGGLVLGIVGVGGVSVCGLALGGIAIGIYRAIGAIAISCYDAIGSIAISLQTASGFKSYAGVEAQGPERFWEYQPWWRVTRGYVLFFVAGVTGFAIWLSVVMLPLAYYLEPRQAESQEADASEGVKA